MNYYSIRRVSYKTGRMAYYLTLDTPEGLIDSRDLDLNELRGRIRVIRDMGWKRKELGWAK